MIDSSKESNGNHPFDDSMGPDILPQLIPSKFSNSTFVKIPVVIGCTVLVFVLLIAGTAATSISFPPTPPQWTPPGGTPPPEQQDGGPPTLEVHTALDGNYKLLGPLLIMAGGFLLVVDVVLCVIVTKESYLAVRCVRPNSIPTSTSMSIWGGPFFLAVPAEANHNVESPFSFTRQLWAVPNAPLPDFLADEVALKGSKNRPRTSTIARCQQPPFNPSVTDPNSTLNPAEPD